MGAEDVINLLEKKKEPLTSTEIAKLINLSSGSVKRILRCLLCDPTIQLFCRELTKKEKISKYNANINPVIRVYWL